MKIENIEEKVKFDPDFIAIKRFDFSLIKLLERFPEGVPDHVIENALDLTTEEAEVLYEGIVVKLQKALNVKIS
jgi:hypothetical protein